MNQILTLLSLYSELVICLVAASVLSLFAGWMLRRSVEKSSRRKAIRGWAKRYQALEATAAADIENLEEQLQHLGSETKTLQATNRVLTDSLKKNDTSIQKARAEAIELNRQHAETQERLQRIIQQRDREIVELGNRVQQATELQRSMRNGSSAHSSAPDTGALHDTEMNHADTIAITPSEVFDATVQMSAQDFIHRNTPEAADASDTELSQDDETEVMFGTELEESTLALDEETLAYAQRSYPSARSD